MFNKAAGLKVCNFFKRGSNTYFKEHLRTTASEYLMNIIQKQEGAASCQWRNTCPKPLSFLSLLEITFEWTAIQDLGPGTQEAEPEKRDPGPRNQGLESRNKKLGPKTSTQDLRLVI